MRALFLTVAVVASMAGADLASAADVTPAAEAKKSDERYVHAIDVPQTVKAYMGPDGFVDPAFPPTIAYPSPFLSDFFGQQAIADVSRAQIRSDFASGLGTFVREDGHSLTLRMAKGYEATFYPLSSLSVMGIVVPISHVAIAGNGWREIRANLADFLGVIQRAGLQSRYLVPNSFYRDELVVARQGASGKAAPITVDPDLALFDRSRDAVLLAPESVHGRPEQADRLIALLGRHRLDWLGMEMISHESQPLLDAYNKAKRGTPAEAAARAKLIAYFADAWNGRAGPKTSGEENYYFKLVEAAHKGGARIIAMEGSSMPFILFRFGETPFGAAVRSYIWAKSIPASGRGAMFGGSAHFNLPGVINAQDFVSVLYPKRPIVSLVDLKAKSKP